MDTIVLGWRMETEWILSLLSTHFARSSVLTSLEKLFVLPAIETILCLPFLRRPQLDLERADYYYLVVGLADFEL